MAVETFAKLGVRYHFFQAVGGRWGPGKVHLQYWSKEHRQWVLLCRPNDAGAFSGYFGHDVEPTTVTCKQCIKKDPRR